MRVKPLVNKGQLCYLTIRLCGLIVRVRVVPRRTVVGYTDRCFSNLSGSHRQSHMNCVSSVYGIYIWSVELLSPGRLNHTNDCDSWVQTIFCFLLHIHRHGSVSETKNTTRPVERVLRNSITLGGCLNEVGFFNKINVMLFDRKEGSSV